MERPRKFEVKVQGCLRLSSERHPVFGQKTAQRPFMSIHSECTGMLLTDAMGR
jgi:hypothetical protein